MRPCGPEPFRRERSMPASLAIRRASGVTEIPPGSRAGPKLRSGVRTSKKGSSLIGCCGDLRWRLGVAAPLAAAGAFGGCGDRRAGLRRRLTTPALPSPMTPTMAPTGATSPSGTRISLKMPASVAGTSIETLSVSISNRLSPGFTASPADLNHLVIFPSATVSPSCGMRMFMRFPNLVRHGRAVPAISLSALCLSKREARRSRRWMKSSTSSPTRIGFPRIPSVLRARLRGRGPIASCRRTAPPGRRRCPD